MKRNFKIRVVSICAIVFFAFGKIAFAQTATGTTFSFLIGQVKGTLNNLFPIAIALGVLAFFYELIRFILEKSEDKKDSFKKGILMSLLALFLMLTFFGILNVFANAVGLKGAVGQGIGVTAGTSGGVLDTAVNTIGGFIGGTVTPILISITLLIFIFNMGFFIVNMGNEAERTKFKKYSLNALIALFVLFCVWGIIGIFTHTFLNTNPVIPQLPTGNVGGS